MMNKKLQGCARPAGLDAVSTASQQQEGGLSVLSLKANITSASLCIADTLQISDRFGRIDLNLHYI